MGSSWKTPDLMVGGGRHAARVAVAMLEVPVKKGEEKGKLDINPDLSAHQRSEIEEVLRKYEDVFADNPKKPSITNVVEHLIETEDARPVKQKSARMSPAMEEEVNKQIDDMLKNGICRPSTSPWSSRVIMVRKKDQSDS